MRRPIEPQLEGHFGVRRRDSQTVVAFVPDCFRAEPRSVGAARVRSPKTVTLEIRLIQLRRTFAVAALRPDEVRVVAGPFDFSVVAVERKQRREIRRFGEPAVAEVDVLYDRALEAHG